MKSQSEALSTGYDYIVSVTQTQGRLLDKYTLYGDGSIFNFDRKLFEVLYTEIENLLKNTE